MGQLWGWNFPRRDDFHGSSQVLSKSQSKKTSRLQVRKTRSNMDSQWWEKMKGPAEGEINFIPVRRTAGDWFLKMYEKGHWRAEEVSVLSACKSREHQWNPLVLTEKFPFPLLMFLPLFQMLTSRSRSNAEGNGKERSVSLEGGMGKKEI